MFVITLTQILGPSRTGVFDVRATKNRLTGAGSHRTLRPHSNPGD